MPFHYLLMAVHAIYNKRVMEMLAGTGLTVGQPKVLDYLGIQDGASQKDIAAHCYIEAATLTSVLNGMEDKGLIERRRLGGNRRTFYIFLTDRGRNLQKQIWDAFSKLEAETFELMSEEESARFMGMFTGLYEHLTK